MPRVYILRCADDMYYVGSTADLEKRIWQLNRGEGAGYTWRRRPVALAWGGWFWWFRGSAAERPHNAPTRQAASHLNRQG